eukprot:CAMPEP_0119541430 /NCGR_PEP_ID=MMETSP1344-20130328/52949_1 /TAXON_ID=236787 /ORGANISM="Florenciella parvula, Strain CCMP2471" /LENGTH=288 /DNA_ID=CAMNT_0007585403 /DNA_START=234 /DNA_END=1097 /DNA_ORIENTATION=-
MASGQGFGAAQEVTPSSFQMDDVAFPGAGGGGGMSEATFIKNEQQQGGNANLSRTPPTNTPSSYGRHVFKRGRMGSSQTNGNPFDGMRRRQASLDGKGGAGLSTSLSGRLRSVSDLERSGIIGASEKGTLKDLIITGDEALRSALDKYQAGDSSELEALISRGHLDRNGSIDLTELDNLDLGSLGIEGMDFLGMFDGDGGGGGTPNSSGAGVSIGGLSAGGEQEGDLDYEFHGNDNFEMDDVLSMPFGGMDELLPATMEETNAMNEAGGGLTPPDGDSSLMMTGLEAR